MPVLFYFSMLVNSSLRYLILLSSCLIRHVGNRFWQKSVVRLHNMECKPTFCDFSCLKDWPSRQTRNWGISSQYFFFRTLQIGKFDDNSARHVCVWRRDTLKTNNPTLRQLFLKYSQRDPTDKLTLRQKEMWQRSMSNHRKKNEYWEQTECTWVSTDKGGRHVERIYLGMHMQNRKACGKPWFRFRKITNYMREIISLWFQDMSASNRTYKYERLVVAWCATRV